MPPPVIGIPLALNVFKMEDDALADPPAYPVGRPIRDDESVMEIVDFRPRAATFYRHI